MLFLPFIMVNGRRQRKQLFFSVNVFHTAFLYSAIGNSWLKKRRTSALVTSLVHPSIYSFLYAFNVYLLTTHFVLGTVTITIMTIAYTALYICQVLFTVVCLN